MGMNKTELMKNGVVALVRYIGSLQGYTHKNPNTGNSYQFAGPNVPIKVYDIRDAEFYEAKSSFEVEMLVLEEQVEADKEDEVSQDEAQDESQDDDEIVEPVKEEKKPPQSKPKGKPKGKPKNKGGVK